MVASIFTSRSKRSGPKVKAEDESQAASDEASTKPSAAGRPSDEPYEPFMAAAQDYFAWWRHYWSARADLLKLQARRKAVTIALAVIGAVAGIASVVQCVGLMLGGVAGGLTVLFGDRVWAGQLATGLLVPALGITGFILWQRRQTADTRRRTIEKYERRRTQEFNRPNVPSEPGRR